MADFHAAILDLLGLDHKVGFHHNYALRETHRHVAGTSCATNFGVVRDASRISEADFRSSRHTRSAVP